MDHHHDHHHHHPGRYAQWYDPEHLKRLDDPERERTMPKDPVLHALELETGMRVADIGCGIGYFSLPLAERVGPSGEIVSVDPSPAARNELTRRRDDAKLLQVVVREGTAERTGLPDRHCDRILWHVMYHEVSDREQAIAEMWRILKPKGRWVVVDWIPEPTEKGPPLEDRVSPAVVAEESARVGFTVVKTFAPGSVTWGVILGKD